MVLFLADLWYDLVKPNLTFETPKQLVVSDWRLGLLNRILQTLVVLYLCLRITIYDEYLLAIPAQYSFAVFGGGSGVAQSQLAIHEQVQNRSSQYCGSAVAANYTHRWDNSTVYTVDGCEARSQAEMFMKRPTSDGVFIPLYNLVSYRFSTPANASAQMEEGGRDEQCWEQMDSSPSMEFPTLGIRGCGAVAEGERTQDTPLYSSFDVSHSAFHRVLQEGPASPGHCVCQAQRAVFTTGIEELELTINHKELVHEHYFPDAAGAVNTYIRVKGSDHNYAVVRGLSNVRLTAGDLLRWAQVDLDAPAASEPNRRWFDSGNAEFVQGPSGLLNGTSPVVRMTGLTINVRMIYHNYGFASNVDEAYPLWQAGPTVCIMEIEPVISWTSFGSQFEQMTAVNDPIQLQREDSFYGINLNVEGSGLIHKFDFQTFLNTVVSTIVLMGSISPVLSYVARYAYGQRSEVYSTVLAEDLNIPKMYRHFAINSLMASLAYDIMDEDQSGDVSNKELYLVLRNIYSEQMYGRHDQQHPARRRRGKRGQEENQRPAVEPDEVAALVEFLLSQTEKHETDDLHLKKEQMKGTMSFLLGGSIRAKNGEDWTVNKSLKRSGLKATKKSLTRSEFVHSFTGGPCTIQGFNKIVQRKIKQGNYIVSEDEKMAYAILESTLRDEDERLMAEQAKQGRTFGRNSVLASVDQDVLYEKLEEEDNKLNPLLEARPNTLGRQKRKEILSEAETKINELKGKGGGRITGGARSITDLAGDIGVRTNPEAAETTPTASPRPAGRGAEPEGPDADGADAGPASARRDGNQSLLYETCLSIDDISPVGEAPASFPSPARRASAGSLTSVAEDLHPFPAARRGSASSLLQPAHDSSSRLKSASFSKAPLLSHTGGEDEYAASAEPEPAPAEVKRVKRGPRRAPVNEEELDGGAKRGVEDSACAAPASEPPLRKSPLPAPSPHSAPRPAYYAPWDAAENASAGYYSSRDLDSPRGDSPRRDSPRQDLERERLLHPASGMQATGERGYASQARREADLDYSRSRYESDREYSTTAYSEGEREYSPRMYDERDREYPSRAHQSDQEYASDAYLERDREYSSRAYEGGDRAYSSTGRYERDREYSSNAYPEEDRQYSSRARDDANPEYELPSRGYPEGDRAHSSRGRHDDRRERSSTWSPEPYQQDEAQEPEGRGTPFTSEWLFSHLQRDRASSAASVESPLRRPRAEDRAADHHSSDRHSRRHTTTPDGGAAERPRRTKSTKSPSRRKPEREGDSSNRRSHRSHKSRSVGREVDGRTQSDQRDEADKYFDI